MNSPIEEIKSRLDIVEFIQTYVRLQKAGINFRANCPFHQERTPSFFVSPTRQIWHCFGCGAGGDIFKFVMQIEGHDFPEALRLLAQRAGVILKREDPAIRSARNRLYDLCEEATKIFERSLALTPAAKTYLQKRGVKEKTIEEFRLGFAPQSWDFLLKSLTTKGFSRDEMEKAGLAIKSEDGSSFYDRFRSRIIFPITDTGGRIIGFGGRIFLPEARTQINADNNADQRRKIEEAKYVNTPNTLLYDKSRALYGFDKAKHEIRLKNQVVIVEGYMDCLMSHQAGVKNTIAVSGTALTPHQLKILRRLCDTMVSSFDTDAAGESATKRSLALAAEFEFERKIAVIPSGKDPADAVLENPQLWQKAIEGAKPVIEFYFEKAFRAHDPATAQGKKEIASLLLPFMAELTNDIERAHWIGELAKKINVGGDAVLGALKKYRQSTTQATVWAPAKNSVEKSPLPSRRNLLEERLLAVLAAAGEDAGKEIAAHRHLAFTSANREALFTTLNNGPAFAATPEIAAELELLKFKGEVISQTTKDMKKELILCARELEKECIKERLLKLGGEIERHEREGAAISVSLLLKDFKTLSEELKVLS